MPVVGRKSGNWHFSFYTRIFKFPSNFQQLALPVLRLFIFCIAFSTAPYNFAAENSDDILQQIKNMDEASLIVGSAENPYMEIRSDLPLIPASTLKLLTALIALQTWNPDHKFITDFDLDENNILWIKGYGDPFLISEEIDLIVINLKKKGLKEINGIGIDDSYFSKNIKIDGQSQTDNPYDASLSALAANFNTLNVIHDQNGLRSAESQTPLTPLIKSLAKNLPIGKHRINLGKQEFSARNFAEILSEKLHEENIIVENKLINGTIPNTINPFYRHQNSHDLSEVITAMLKYSNNFIANQLFLLIGAESKGAPASMEKSRSTFDQKIKAMFNWKDQIIIEGSGLSRNNRITARQLADVLDHFSPYRQLLKKQNDQILAKSGTLKGISTYAGYLYKKQKWVPFVMMFNQPVKYHFRKHVAEELLKIDPDFIE